MRKLLSKRPSLAANLFVKLLLISSISVRTMKAASSAAKAGIVWFKGTDMRVRDHLPLSCAHTECETVDHVFVFDPRQYQTTRRGYLKAGPRRLKFQVDALNDLSASLESRGCGITIIIGEPEIALVEYAQQKRLAGRPDTYLYCFDEVADEELRVQESTMLSVNENCRISLKSYWGGGTLLEPSQLPFPIAGLEFFTGFRKKVETPVIWSKLKKPVPIPDTFKPSSSHAGCSAGSSAPAASATSLADGAGASGGDAIPLTSKIVEGPISDIRSLWSTLRNWYGKPVSAASAAPPLPEDAAVGLADDRDFDIDSRSVLNFVGGETAAWVRVDHYICNGDIDGRLKNYKELRNGLVGADYSTKLSAYLAIGAITARSVYWEVKRFEERTGIANDNTYWVVFELLWRDYMRFYTMKHGTKMFHLGGPQGAEGRKKHPWKVEDDKIDAWKEGRTGYPFIDANMRELKYSGWMSNRGRQNVASYFVRDLEQDWRYGAEHFESLLLDHDVCSNYGNWNYGAGVGADPREDRYFNIVKQGHDYDPDCTFIRLWCPELAALPNNVLLDSRLLTDPMRERYNIPESVYPKPVCMLKHAAFRPPAGGGAGAGGGGGNSAARGGAGGHAKKAKKGMMPHGGVPGRSRFVEDGRPASASAVALTPAVVSATAGGGSGGGGNRPPTVGGGRGGSTSSNSGGGSSSTGGGGGVARGQQTMNRFIVRKESADDSGIHG